MVEAEFASHIVDDNLPLNHSNPDSAYHWILFLFSRNYTN